MNLGEKALDHRVDQDNDRDNIRIDLTREGYNNLNKLIEIKRRMYGKVLLMQYELSSSEANNNNNNNNWAFIYYSCMPNMILN